MMYSLKILIAEILPGSITSHENNYYRKIVTYHDVVPSILACSVERWTGFGEMREQTRIDGRTS
jgi:hypothetical protein